MHNPAVLAGIDAADNDGRGVALAQLFPPPRWPGAARRGPAETCTNSQAWIHAVIYQNPVSGELPRLPSES